MTWPHGAGLPVGPTQNNKNKVLPQSKAAGLVATLRPKSRRSRLAFSPGSADRLALLLHSSCLRRGRAAQKQSIRRAPDSNSVRGIGPSFGLAWGRLEAFGSGAREQRGHVRADVMKKQAVLVHHWLLSRRQSSKQLARQVVMRADTTLVMCFVSFLVQSSVQLCSRAGTKRGPS